MLSGVRVLDLTRLLPGPFASQILADLGAEVIKIEQPIIGDYLRINTGLCIDGNSIAFHAVNRGKKSVTLNLKSASDKILFDTLLSTADVMMESFRPGVMKKLGFASSDLLKKYPSLIICSISGYGQSGPHHLRAGHDINYISRAGLLNLMKNPALPPVQIADICGGSWPAVFQIVACLYARTQNGNKGNIIDVSMTDCSYALGVIQQAMAKNLGKKISGGKYALSGGHPCYGVYQCKDGYVSVGSLEPKFWKSFCLDILQAPHLVKYGFAIDDENERVRKEICSIMQQKTCEEWEMVVKKFDCCVKVVPMCETVTTEDEQLKYRDLDLNVEVIGKNGKTQNIIIAKSPLNMLNGVVFQKKGGAKLGEQNKELLSKL